VNFTPAEELIKRFNNFLYFSPISLPWLVFFYYLIVILVQRVTVNFERIAALFINKNCTITGAGPVKVVISQGQTV